MSRIQPPDPDKVREKAKKLLDAIKTKTGRVPNIFKTMAHSPVALQAYLGLSEALAGATLTAKVREQIALTLAEDNQCHYCAAAHSALGKMTGLTPVEIEDARRARAAEPKTNAILQLAKKLSANRGNITDQELEATRRAGCSAEEIFETLTAVTLNLFTNYFNHVADPAIDFPQVPPLEPEKG